MKTPPNTLAEAIEVATLNLIVKDDRTLWNGMLFNTKEQRDLVLQAARAHLSTLTRPTISGELEALKAVIDGLKETMEMNAALKWFPAETYVRMQSAILFLESLASRNLITAKRTEGWQPIETAPKDGEYTLVYCPSDRYKVKIAQMCWETNHGYYWEEPDCSTCLPTHWMPLPEQPTAEDRGV